MNIGIVTTWFERGAAYVSRQYRELLLPEHNVFVYSRGGESFDLDDPNWSGAFVTRGKETPVPVATAVNYNDFLKWLSDTQVDIVIFNEQHWWLPVAWCKERGVITGAYVDYYTEETIPLFAAYDFLICNTQRHYSLFDWHPCTFYIPWGTDVNLFSPKSLGSAENGVVTFFHSAGMSPSRKGCDLVIQAFSRISGPAQLIIHSQVSLKRKFTQINNLIADLESSGRLTIIEQTIPAPGLYHRGDVYVYPSRLEGIGLTIAEALASGLPVITSDNPPMNEFVNDSNGRLVTVEKFYARLDGYFWPQCQVDLKCLQDCMQYYVDNVNNLHELKKQARKFALQNLDWSKNKLKLLDIFSSVKSVDYTCGEEAIKNVYAFENKRSGVRVALSMRHPLIYRLLCRLSKVMKDCTGRRA